MRVDVVAAPMRYRRTPLLLLLGIALLPALGLYATFQWLDGEADRYDETRSDVEALSISEDQVSAPTRREIEQEQRAARLETSLFDYRRTPEAVAESASVNRLRSQVASALPFVNDASCAAISVDGVAVGSVNDTLAVTPASNLKLIVAAVALEILGPDYTFVTTVQSPPAVDGVIDGNIYLVGGGDPLLTSDDYPIENDARPAFSTTSFDALADALVARGIERINGSVVGDGSRYDDEFVVDGWGDGVAFDSAGPYDALMVNDARVRGRGGVEDDPNAAASREFVRLLENRGIRVTDGWASGPLDPEATVVDAIESQPLAAIVREMLINSDNNTAEMLLKEIGVASRSDGTRFAGLLTLDETLLAWGLPLDGVRLLDGSGLHPESTVTCALILGVLQRSRGTSLPTSLPLAGQTGTLSGEFLDSPLVGRLFAKTGTLNNPPVDEPPPAVKALAGYVPTSTGATVEFALIINAPEIDDAEYQLVWSVFAQRFSTYPEGPVAEEMGPR